MVLDSIRLMVLTMVLMGTFALRSLALLAKQEGSY